MTLLRDHYVAEYQRTKGTKPVLTKRQWPSAMKSFKELLGATKQLDGAKRIITNAFDDRWHRENQCQPWEIVKHANKHHGAAEGPRKANGRIPPPQQGLAEGTRAGTI